MAGQSAWDLIQPGINSFIQSFDPKNVPVSSGWKDAAKEQNTLRRRLQDYAPGVSRGKPVSSEQSKPAYAGSRKGAMMGVPNDPSYKTEELEQGQKAEDFRAGAGFTGQTPTVSTRDVQKADGSKGTRTSPGGTPILDAAGAARFLNNLQVGTGQFSSTQLPMTQSSMWEKGSVDAQAFGGLEPSYTSNTLGSYTASPKAFANLDSTGTGSEFNANSQVIPDAALRIGQATGAIPAASSISSGRLADALSDQAGMQSYMSKFGDADADRQRRANAAFLNTEGSMKGLRAKEAELAMFYAGGQHLSLNGDGSEFLRNEDGQNIAANPDDVRNYKSGNMTAEQFRDTFKGAVNQTYASAKDSESTFAKNPVEASYQAPNTNFGPVMDTEEMGKRLDASIGMNGTFGTVIDGDVYGSFLDGRREPSMRGMNTGNRALPITVDNSNIPDDLYSTEGQKYLRDLQAGRLTSPSPYSRQRYLEVIYNSHRFINKECGFRRYSADA